MGSKSFGELTLTGGDDWTAEDLASLISNFYVLYNRLLVLESKRYRSASGLKSQLYSSKGRVDQAHKLAIESITIKSPMKLNLRGSGKFVKQIRKLIGDLSGKNKLRRQLIEEELRHKKRKYRLEEAHQELELIESIAGSLDNMNAAPEEREKIISAILHPALEAAEMIDRKSLQVSPDKSED